MREDLRELGDDMGFQPSWKRSDLFLQILRSVDEGSSYTSPFLHCSWDFYEARKWYVKGRELRRETANIMVRIEVAKLNELVRASSQEVNPSLDYGLVPGHIVDISSHAKAQKVLLPQFVDERVQSKLKALGHAHSVKEVLVAWRGKIDASLFEVIDPDSGVTVLYVTQSCSRGMGKPSVTQQRTKIGHGHALPFAEVQRHRQRNRENKWPLL